MDSGEPTKEFFITLSDLFSNDDITSFFEDERILILRNRVDSLQVSVCLSNSIMLLSLLILIFVLTCSACCKTKSKPSVIYAEPVKIAERLEKVQLRGRLNIEITKNSGKKMFVAARQACLKTSTSRRQGISLNPFYIKDHVKKNIAISQQ